jgi:hypothetical protein
MQLSLVAAILKLADLDIGFWWTPVFLGMASPPLPKMSDQMFWGDVNGGGGGEIFLARILLL